MNYGICSPKKEYIQALTGVNNRCGFLENGVRTFSGRLIALSFSPAPGCSYHCGALLWDGSTEGLLWGGCSELKLSPGVSTPEIARRDHFTNSILLEARKAIPVRVSTNVTFRLQRDLGVPDSGPSVHCETSWEVLGWSLYLYCAFLKGLFWR